MPSPSIPHSKSAPDINALPSSKSVVTSKSAGSPLTTWPKKFSGLIKGKAKNSNLTEETLFEFNRRNALVEARYSSSSPYYKGLTDFSLVINREKLSGSSPGRESRATSYVTSGSRSSFAVKVQEWGGSCFTSKKNDSKSSSPSSLSSWTKSSHENRVTTSSSSSSSRAMETVVLTKIKAKKAENESVSGKKRVTILSTKIEDDTTTSPNVKKPLRERDYGTPPMLPLSPPIESPPASLPYPLPQITPPNSQATFSPLPTPPPNSQASFSPPPTPPLNSQASFSPPPPPQALVLHSSPPAVESRPCERKYIWSDKYRPFWLRDFLCNREKALWLQEIVRSWHDTQEECGHFIFEGNPGVGKRTMIWALLREAFGPDKVQIREESKKFYLKGEAVSSILVNLMVSPQHVEVNLSELKGYEKHVIVELIKEKSLTLLNTSLNCNQENCKAIILYEADRLSSDALSYIKWMLEKFKGCNKVFFCCKDAKKLQHVMPLCRFVQLNKPSIEEIIGVLKFIAEKEGIQLPHPLAYKIASNSQNNLRQAIRSFEATCHTSCSTSLTEDQDIKTGWEDKIANIAKNVLEEQSPKQLYNIRGELQNLIEHNVAPEFIFQTLKVELKKILPEQLQPQFDHLYDEYQKNYAGMKYLSYAHQEDEVGEREYDQRKNVQKFMRIEEFIARFMSWYKGLRVKDVVV